MFINRFSTFLPRGRVKKALEFFNSGRYGKASREFERYLESVNEAQNEKSFEMVRMYFVESLIGYSRELADRGQYEEAARQLETAIKYQPKYADVHYFLGSLYEELSRSEDAARCYERALDINPKFFKARVRLARRSYRNDDIENAVIELENCIKSAPTFFVGDLKRLVTSVKKHDSSEEIEETFEHLLEEVPISSEVSKQIAIEHIQNGDYDAAINELKKALSSSPDFPDLRNLLGIAFANKGMTDDAIMEFKAALKIHPDYLKARLNIALAFYEKGAFDEAIENVQWVLKLDPDNELAKNLMNELEPVHKR
ncbi:MAG: hypothetical protein B6D63_06245 [Candidatus Latescibacteria bacterium 4484_7]|nr:MAG: hypothetical protein B6D63_06245 [Candidatus Latescibacteria bacterium 4484_7]RKZ08765.1 MAG: hypothetical protein DRQ05_00900 [bacterium]